MVRTKVFVGNLSFKTGEKELAKEFEIAGKVASANIISRGSRSLGYGFVEMESEEEARKSVELLNKKLIDNREINVEVARPREENPNAGAPGAGNNVPQRRRSNPRRFFRRRPSNSQQPQTDASGAPIPASNSPSGNRSNNGENPSGRGGRGGSRGGRGRRRFPSRREGGPAPGGAPAAPRPPRPERPVKVAPPNSVFVANLPFKLDDESLANVFAKLNLKEPVKASHVVKDRFGFSKGYGFVEFANSEDQQKALTADKTDVDARQIIVKAAFTEPPPPKNANNAPATTASSTPTGEVEVKA